MITAARAKNGLRDCQLVNYGREFKGRISSRMVNAFSFVVRESESGRNGA
jgi:hypothetical protein